MSDTNQEEARAELAGIVEQTRRQLEWMKDAGIRTVRRESEAASAPSSHAPAQASARTRPAFLEQPPTTTAPPSRRPAAVDESAMPAPRMGTEMAGVARAGDEVALLKVIRDELGDCRRCGLCSTRKNIVFGQGSATAPVVFLGEGPGEDEDESGLAFVGRAGQLLTKMIEAMGFTRDEVYICNIVKCRPPGNRRPEPDEVETCRPFVERQLRAIRPQAIVALGATAAQSLLRTTTSISRLRNSWTEWEGIPVMPTFHPSYLLRAPNEKAKAWDDLKLVMAKVGRPVAKK